MATNNVLVDEICVIEIPNNDEDGEELKQKQLEREEGVEELTSRRKEEIFTISRSVDTLIYKKGLRLTTGDCEVCLMVQPWSWQTPCCKTSICISCLDTYISGKVDEGVIDIKCPGNSCSELLDPVTIKKVIKIRKSKRLSYLRVKAGRYKSRKACPFCDYISSVDKPVLDFYEKYESILVCPECSHEWCIDCMAPWHEGMTCGEYKGSNVDTGVKEWAAPKGKGKNRKAQMCPECKTWIERIEGCNMMTCKGCNTKFCYDCGFKTPHTDLSTCVHAGAGVQQERNGVPVQRPLHHVQRPIHQTQIQRGRVHVQRPTHRVQIQWRRVCGHCSENTKCILYLVLSFLGTICMCASRVLLKRHVNSLTIGLALLYILGLILIVTAFCVLFYKFFKQWCAT